MNKEEFGWFAYQPDVEGGPDMGGVAYSSAVEVTGDEPGRGKERLRWSDMSSLLRGGSSKLARTARAMNAQSPADLIVEHLQGDIGEAVTSRNWPTFELPNLQRAMDQIVSEPDVVNTHIGLLNPMGMPYGISELVHGGFAQIRIGGITHEQVMIGPEGQKLACVKEALHLMEVDGNPVVLLRTMGERGMPQLEFQALATKESVAQALLDRIADLALRLNVYRGKVLTFAEDMFDSQYSALKVLPRPQVDAEDIVLPDEVLDQVDRQIVQLARHTSALRAAGQHVRRGVLLYGPPGTGKTHLIRHLIGRLPEHTVLVLTGEGIRGLAMACSVARTLNPAIVVIEDIDLIAMDRDYGGGDQSMLFELLNQMDGLEPEADVTFLLTTNRADLLEGALAARPGRVDLAVHLPLPTAQARRALLDLYRPAQGWHVDDVTAAEVVERIDGTTASFVKELVRRAVLVSLHDHDPGMPSDLLVTSDHLRAATSELLDSGSQLTRRALGVNQ
ncbi:MAG: ATP-binding protein [Ornithinimicrobium sp.]